MTNGLVRSEKILGKRTSVSKAGVKNMKRIVIGQDS